MDEETDEPEVITAPQSDSAVEVSSGEEAPAQSSATQPGFNGGYTQPYANPPSANFSSATPHL